MSGKKSGRRGGSRNSDSHSNGGTHSSRSSHNFYSDDKEKILDQLSEGVRIELEGTHWQIASYSPLQFVIAHNDLKRIVHAYVNKETTELGDASDGTVTKEYEILKFHKATLDAIPTAVVREINPPGFESAGHRYTITFETNGYNKKPFTIKCKTLEEIFAQLRQMSLVPESRGGFDDLCKIVASFDKTKSTIVKEDLETPGFYIVQKKLKAYHLTDGEAGSLPKQPSNIEVKKCIDVIEKLVTKCKRRELIPTILKWGIAAPFSFVLRQYTEDSVFLPWLYPYGRTRTGKTTFGNIPPAIWRKYHDSKHKIPFTKIDTPARFGDVISKTTFPLVINEVSVLGEDKFKHLLEMFKNAIETRVARGKFFQKTEYKDIPALSACVLTGNPRPPTDSGFQSRIVPISFTKEDEHTDEEKKEFKVFFTNEVVPNIGALGDFTANYVMNHPECLLRPNKEECDSIAFATFILKEFYNSANRPLPDWIELFVEERVLESNTDDTRLQVRAFFINAVNEAFQKYSRVVGLGETVEPKSLEERLKFCLENNAMPFMALTNNGDTIVVLSNVMKEMYNNQRFGIDQSEVASMQELAHVMGLEYGQKWLNGANTRAVYGDHRKFVQFMGSEISDQENKTSANGDIAGIEKFRFPEGVYRIGRTDTFGCKFCNVRDDKWGMAKHQCSRKKS